MASLNCPAWFSTSCFYGRSIKVDWFSFYRLITANTSGGTTRNKWMGLAATMLQVGSITKTRSRQNIPTKKLLVDPFRQGIIVEGGVGYKQTIVIRSYEVGADKTATLETDLNLLQIDTCFFFFLFPRSLKMPNLFCSMSCA